MALAPFGRTLIPRMRQLNCQRRYARQLVERWQTSLPGRVMPALIDLPLHVQLHQPGNLLPSSACSLAAAFEYSARVRLVGAIGTGRSLAVQQFLLAWANGTLRLSATPIYLHVPSASQAPDETFRAALQAVGFETDPIVVERGFAAGAWMPVLDDWDGASATSQAVWRKWLLNLTARYPVLDALVVTGDDRIDWADFTVWTPVPITTPRLEQWLAQLLPHEEPGLLIGPLVSDERLQVLGERLLDVAALALTYERNGFPPGRSRLYATAIDYILRPVVGPDLTRTRTSLGALGFQALSERLPPRVSAELRPVIEQLGGLVSIDSDRRIHFAHPIFHAFCIALYLAAGGKLAEFDPAAPIWQQALPLAAGLIADPAPLYTAIRGPGQPDNQRTLLLGTCLREHRAPLPGWSAAILGGLARMMVLDDQDSLQATRLIVSMSDVVAATIAQQLMEGPPGERWAVAFLRLLPAQLATSHLIDLLGDSRLLSPTRRAAALHLRSFPETVIIKPLTSLAERALDDLGRILTTLLLSTSGPVGRRYLAQLIRAGRTVFPSPGEAADKRHLVDSVSALLNDQILDQATHTAAAVALRHCATAETAPLIVRACQSPSAPLREAARQALQTLEPALVVGALVRLITDAEAPWTVRAEALQMLQRLPGPAITAVLARLLTSPLPLAARLQLGAALRQRSPAAAERFLATLEHPALTAGSRAALLAMLDRPAVERSLPLLFRLIQSSEPVPLRSFAIRALRHSRADEVLAILAGIVEHERDDLEPLCTAIEVLGQAGDESAILALRSILLAPLAEQFRARWEQALGQISPSLTPAAWAVETLPADYQARWGFAMADGTTGADAPTSLGELITRETHQVRTQAVRALRTIGGPVATQVLREALLTTAPINPPWPEFGVADGGLAGVPDLMYALEASQPPAACWVATHSLQQVARPALVPGPPLLELEPHTRTSMLQELGGDYAVIPVLESLIVDQSAPLNLRLDAVAALGSGGAPHAEGLLLAVLSTARATPALQRAALDAMPLPLSMASLSTIRQLVRDTRPSPEVGAAALRCLARVGDREALALFLRFAQHDVPLLAIAAIEGLAMLNDASATPMLHRLAQSAPVQIRLYAIGALLKLEGNIHLALLRSSLETGSLPTRLLALEMLIANLAHPADVLLEYIDATWPLPLRLRTAQILAAQPTAAHLHALLQMLDAADDSLVIRCLALDAVSAARYTPALESIEILAADDEAPLALRRRAITGLQGWRSEASSALLLSTLAEAAQPWVRSWAVTALTKLDLALKGGELQ